MARRKAPTIPDELLADVPAVTIPPESAWARSNWQSYCVRLAPGLDQRTVMQAMLDRGVATRRGIMCAHREVPYCDAVKLPPLAVSEAGQDHGILLPLYPDMVAAEQEAVVAALVGACRCGMGLVPRRPGARSGLPPRPAVPTRPSAVT